MSLGIMVTMNQRLDAETLTIVADEFGYEMQFITTAIEENAVIIEETEDSFFSSFEFLKVSILKSLSQIVLVTKSF